MNKPIFTWKGIYVGFVEKGDIYDTDGAFLGWVEPEGKTVWKKSGEFVGVLDGSNVVRRTREPKHMQKAPRFPVLRHTPHTPVMRKTPKMVRPGWADVFDDLLA